MHPRRTPNHHPTTFIFSICTPDEASFCFSFFALISYNVAYPPPSRYHPSSSCNPTPPTPTPFPPSATIPSSTYPPQATLFPFLFFFGTSLIVRPASKRQFPKLAPILLPWEYTCFPPLIHPLLKKAFSVVLNASKISRHRQPKMPSKRVRKKKN